MSATVESLNSEWVELAGSASPLLTRWGDVAAFQGLRTLDEVVERVRLRPDPTLAALLTLGAAGDRLAWRVVLQAMLPKAIRLSGGSEERLAEAVSELWLAIADYPLARRPRSIAANLAWTLQRRLASRPAPLLISMPTDLDAADILATARRLGLIDADTHRTLWLVYIAGLTSAAAADQLGISADLVRYRCSRDLRRLAGRAELLAA